MRLHGLRQQFSLGLLISLAFWQPLFAEPTLQSVAAGTSIEAGQWRVKPVRARLATEHPLPYPPVKSDTYLLVEIEFTNLTQRSSSDYGFVVHFEQPELKQLGDPTFVLVRDMTLPDRLHPDMPEALLLVWPWAPGAAAPSELRFSIHAKTYKPVDNLVGSPGWFNPAPVARATLSLSAE